MSKAKFTYDESGTTFFYFVLSFLALILVPATYYLWPNEIQNNESKKDCRCPGCQSKRQHMNESNKWKRSRRKIIRGIIIVGWVAIVIVAYKCLTIQHEYVNWDPFEILGVQVDAPTDEVKKAYRELSKIHHPDKKTGNQEKFVQISKAYAALTDDVARKNWEEYGNPDGPGALSFGIALPSWIVQKENSVVVLGIYVLAFMVVLPVSVGLWWYKSVKYGCDKVLINTTELYYYLIHKTPNMALKRVIMILAASLEFSKSHNPEVVERPTDNQEVPRLIRDLSNLSEKNKERPLCFSYSIKSRAIIHAHLSRMKLPSTTLELDRCFIVSKCPYLLHEFVQCVAQLITLALSGRIQNMPNLVTLENAMKLCPMVVQALWEYQSPLLQLPHITEDTLRMFERRKDKRIKLKSIEQLARMNDTDRRAILKNFSDSQYEDIKFVMSSMPTVSIESRFEVLDDEDPGIITAGSIVTVAVKLRRRNLRELFDKSEQSNLDVDSESKNEETFDESPVNNSGEESDSNNNNGDEKKIKPTKEAGSNGVKSTKTSTSNGKVKNSGDDQEIESKATKSSDEDEDEWDKKFQEQVIKKQKVFESKSRKSHPVHCPFFPEDKQEFWWVYVVDRKRHALVTAPLLVTCLTDTEDIEMKFTAPGKPGSYAYTIVCRSDSYVDCTVQKTDRIDVKPARIYVELPYDIPEEDIEEDVEDECSAVEDSDLLTDDDD